MSIKAVAFHEAVGIENIEEYFHLPESDLLTNTRAGKCVKCNLAFAVVLAAKSDPRNPEYVGHLNAIIADDCKGGNHKHEYVLDEPGPPHRLI